MNEDTEITSIQESSDEVKHYLADPRYRIELDDLVIRGLKQWLATVAESAFSTQTSDVTEDTFAARLSDYESITQALQTTAALLAYWGRPDHLPTMRKIVTHIYETARPTDGRGIWRVLCWYPAILITYTAGIAAVAAENYGNLACMLLSHVSPTPIAPEQDRAILQLGQGLAEIDGNCIFHRIPHHSRSYTARSEYLYHTVQPLLADLLFLGSEYESLFDRFEMLLALTYADQLTQTGDRVWGPFGRFAWKYRNRSLNPYTQLLAEAERQKADWPPIQAGLFSGSYDRFEEIASAYRQVLDNLPWH